MATQQVKFHSVTAEKYGKIASPEAGSLYFITDNGEIRKGSSHITGSRVYTATDPTGTSAVATLTISLGNVVVVNAGTADNTKELPKKGDMLLVEQYLSRKNETYWEKDGEEVEEGTTGATQKTRKVLDPNGTKGYSSYVYVASGAYSSEGWQACCEKVDASKVILTQDYQLAGNYTSVGNIAKSSGTYSSSGKSVSQVFQDIFLKRLQPGTPTQPAVTLKINNANSDYTTSAEVGTTVDIPNYSATLSAGSYTYNATGITASGWSVTETKGNTTKTTNTGTLPSVVADDTQQSYTVTATATYAAGAQPTDNLGDPAESQNPIAAGSKSASHTVKVNGFRKSFYMVLPPECEIDPTDANFLSGSYQIPGTDLTLDSDTIRDTGIAHAVQDSDANLASIAITEYNATTNPTGEGPFMNILVFRPASANQNKKLMASTANGLPYIKSPGAYPINGTISINGANDIKPTDYCCWVIPSGDAPVASDTVSLTWA